MTENAKANSIVPFIVLMSFLLIGFILEASMTSLWGPVIKVAVLFVVAFKYWRLHQLPKNRTRLTWGLMIAGWSLLLGFAGSIWMPYRSFFTHSFCRWNWLDDVYDCGQSCISTWAAWSAA